MIINSLRSHHKNKTTAKVFIDGKYFADSLEDVSRPANVKVQDETCIPNGVYKVAVSRSNRFKKTMLIIYNVDSNHSILLSGVGFTGIRVHGGTTINHTAGCVLIKDYKIMQSKIEMALNRGDVVYWVFSDGIE